MDWVYSHPVFRHSTGVPVKNRVAVSPFHRYLERVYSHPVFHTSPSIYTEVCFSSCFSISIVAAVILSTIANAEASKTGWLYDLSREIWKGAA